MNEIFLISYFNSSPESVFSLRRLVEEITLRGKDFIISSHSSVPTDIIEKSKGYVFDPVNHLIEIDPWMVYWVQAGRFKIYSKFLHYGSISNKGYGVAAVKNILNGIYLANNLGYQVVHSIEYDCIPKFEDLEENFSLIIQEKFDCIVYKGENSEMLGCVFTIKSSEGTRFNLSNLEIESFFKQFNFFSEKGLYELIVLWFGKEMVLNKNKEIQPNGQITSVFSNQFHIENVIFENPLNRVVSVYLNNSSKHQKQITVYYDGGKKIIVLPPHQWIISDLDNISDLTFVDFFVNGKMVREWDLSDPDKYQKYVLNNKIEIL